ncbi:MAG TPA: FAD-dependent monooxygenase [Polyangium sp.]|nr:FAD-dependent monooxygenase [Polyangium sp.]
MEKVLVVGAGPVGLTMAIELLRHGVPCRVIEQHQEKHTQSRATDIHARTLEVFQNMGVVDEILERSKHRSGVRIFIDGRCTLEYRYEDFGGDTPYCYDVGLLQHHTEEVLEHRLVELGGRVERGTKLAIQTQTEDSVKATLLYPNGQWEEVEFPWLIACDGARSAARQWLLDVPLAGSTFEEEFFLADVTFESDPFVDVITIYTGPRGMLCILPVPGDRTHRIFGELEVGSSITEMTLATCQTLMDDRVGQHVKIESAGWNALFRVHTRMVKQYRHGRVFLVGDAAHIHSPVGGHGMNVGILDAYNLAWKLALVCRGKAHSNLLDTYDPERSPVARAMLEDTDTMTKNLMLRGGIAQLLLSRALPILNKLPPQRRKAIETMLDIGFNYRASPLAEEHVGSVLKIRLRSTDQDELASFRERIDFSSGPQPGDRAPNVKMNHIGVSNLFDLMLGTQQVLFLFDGQAATSEGYTTLAAIAKTVGKSWGSLIKTYIVVPRSSRPPELGSEVDEVAQVLLDPDNAIHRRYGATKECLYLIRPDGHVGFRSQPADKVSLVAYLEKWYRVDA